MRPFVLLALLAGAAPPALAQTPAVDQARAQGAVGERFDGYMGVAGPVSGALRSQVAAINIKRRTLYSRLAAEKGVSPADVGITAGCKLLAQVAVGQSYLLADSQWRRRTVGQGSVAPAYCG